MVNDDRDRRDRPDADDAEPPRDAPESEALDPEGASSEPEDQEAPPETSGYEPTSTAEVEGWPSEPSASEPAGDADETRTWPTEPPAAAESSEDAWPTTSPGRDDEPPPPEVEAHTAAQPADEPPSDTVAGAHSVPAATSAAGESTQCPRCATENRPGLAFCRNCGQRLVAAGASATVERPGVPEGSTACPRCGTHNRSGVAFCQNCGANLRPTAPGYVPPAVDAESAARAAGAERGGAVLGPVVLLVGLVGLVTGYLLPFAYGNGALFERATGANGYGVAFWAGYPEVGAGLADQAYFGLAAPLPIFGLLLLALAVAGFIRAVAGRLQTVGLIVAMLWSIGLVVLFLVVELGANWDGDLVGVLRVLTPAGIIFFLSSLIVLIGTLTRFGRS